VADIELDLRHLQERLTSVEVQDIRPLRGGASSLTYVGRIGRDDTQRVVVKVAPAGVPPVRNRDVLRQARLMRTLHPTAVPVPEVLWEDVGDPPEEPPLFVMSFTEGVALEPLFDQDLDGEGDDEKVVAERMRNAARVMAELHALDPGALGLASEPVVGPAGEVERWCRLLETVDPALVPGWEAVAAALRADEPAALPGAVVHGDFRLGNMLAAGARIAAVIDWEIWSVGDPRVDVGWFLTSADPRTYGRSTRYVDSLPEPAELAAIYRGAFRREVPELGWFEALACFKAVATWSLIVKHNRRRPAPDPAIGEMASVLPHLLERTLDVLR
jgi:aminoglycoside phosphotransferase (APT) family kinase protein